LWFSFYPTLLITTCLDALHVFLNWLLLTASFYEVDVPRSLLVWPLYSGRDRPVYYHLCRILDTALADFAWWHITIPCIRQTKDKDGTRIDK
jgi:hypothetical protein